MPYKDEYHPKVRSDLKKLDKSVARDIYDIQLDNVLGEPHMGQELHGELEGISTFHFRKNKVEYRISYIVDESSKTVFVLILGTRENFYNILRRRLK